MRLDTPDFGEHQEIWEQLEPFGPAVAREALAAARNMRNWQGRTTLVLKVTRWAKVEEGAFQLGIATTRDVNPVVRTRACGLLAYAQRDDALPALEALLGHADKSVRESAAAAIDAIILGNHHFFLDRKHTGKTHWNPEND